MARFAIDGDDLRVEKDIDIFVVKALAQAGLRGLVTIHEGQHLAHATMVRWELIVQLAENTAHVRLAIDKGDPVTGFSQVKGRADTANSGTDHQRFTHFLTHQNSLFK